MAFSKEEGRRLTEFCAAFLRSELCGGPEPVEPELEALRRPGCCFVTLKDADGALRGCIGHLEAFENLGDNLMRNCFNAAFSDPRFEPLEADELDGLQIEISVLSPMKPIASWRDFLPGRDGIVLELSGRSAVFLPQVAEEEHWNREETLGQLSRKAGLPVDAWRNPEAHFKTFTAEVIPAKD